MFKIYFPDIGKKSPKRLLTLADRGYIVPSKHDQPNRSAPLLWDTLFLKGLHALPKAITNFFASDNTFPNVEFEEAIPEHHTAFDNYGKGRMCDLLIRATFDSGTIVISTEAKVDEAFDARYVSTYKQEAEVFFAENPNSKRKIRIQELIPFVFSNSNDEGIDKLRYQLVQAVASAVIEAEKENAIAIFCVLNFVPEEPSESYKFNRARNDNELNSFVQMLKNNSMIKLSVGKLEGPFYLPARKTVPLYFLKLDQNFKPI